MISDFYIFMVNIALTALDDLKDSPSLLGHLFGLWDEGREPHQQCAFLLQGQPNHSHPDSQEPGQSSSEDHRIKILIYSH